MHASNDDIKQVTFSLPVDKPLSEGFVVAVILHLLVLIGLIVWILDQPIEKPVQQIPLELIRFGLGEGEGSGGNLTAAGAPRLAPPSENPLENASRQQTVKQKIVPADQYQNGMKVAAANVSKARSSRDTVGGTGRKDIGARNGTPNGTGLGGTGAGEGSGLGFGIDWGGGGNRVVLNKVLPSYPAGANKDAQIRIRFNVRPDGSVGAMIPVQKGDPRMEDAALSALRQWKFNPLQGSSIQQVGEITFYFKIE